MIDDNRPTEQDVRAESPFAMPDGERARLPLRERLRIMTLLPSYLHGHATGKEALALIDSLSAENERIRILNATSLDEADKNYLALWAENDTLRARVAALEGALPANIESFDRAASIFSHYEKLHRAKGPEGAEKAERNAEYAGYFHAEANALRALLPAEQEGKDHG